MAESWLAEKLVCDSSVDILWKVGNLGAIGLRIFGWWVTAGMVMP